MVRRALWNGPPSGKMGWGQGVQKQGAREAHRKAAATGEPGNGQGLTGGRRVGLPAQQEDIRGWLRLEVTIQGYLSRSI